MVKQQNGDASDAMKTFLKYGEGCSTLDMLKRVEKLELNDELTQEMKHLCDIEKERIARRSSIKIEEASPLTGFGQANGTLKYKEKNGLLEPKFKPQVYNKKILVNGKLRQENEPALITSISRPELVKTARGVNTTLSNNSQKEDEAYSKSSTDLQSMTHVPNDASYTDALEKKKIELENELFKTTRKLYKKYDKLTQKREPIKGSTVKKMIKQWSTSELPSNEKYKVYMSNRYITHSETEYYKKRPDARDKDSSFHRKNNFVTKYGDARFKIKNSLRDPF